ncbi:MAG: SRPBCC family protein [Gallionellaceae bacterium]|nr:SRPBCC family protein [Gallionellaceae bacterium]
MLKIIAIVAGILLAALLILAASKPDTFRVERSISIKAPPEKIFALINDFHQWEAWSPWEKMDLSMKKTHSGSASFGKGAIYEWEGNNKVGQGRMEIVESSPSARVLIKLDFLQPMEAHNTAEFTLQPQGDSTKVTWAMYGPAPFISKLMQVFASMDSLVGKDFERGLTNIKTIV